MISKKEGEDISIALILEDQNRILTGKFLLNHLVLQILRSSLTAPCWLSNGVHTKMLGLLSTNFWVLIFLLCSSYERFGDKNIVHLITWLSAIKLGNVSLCGIVPIRRGTIHTEGFLWFFSVTVYFIWIGWKLYLWILIHL